MTLSPATEAAAILDRLGVDRALYTGGSHVSFSPVTGTEIAPFAEIADASAVWTVRDGMAERV